MATLQNIGKLKYRGKDGQWLPLPVVVQDADGSVSTISGKGAPTSATQGKMNQLYRDEDTQKLYICTAVSGGYTWAAVSGGSVDVDTTLTKAGYAADAKAAGDAIGRKLDKAQGVENAGKILGIGNDGNVVPEDKPVQALAGADAPTTATAGVVGQEYYVNADGAVTEMYVCTAVANGTYTWDKVEFGGGGLSSTEKNLIVTILRNAVYSSDQSANITSLASQFGISSPPNSVIIEQVVRGTVSYENGKLHIAPLATRALVKPIGQYLTKGKTYKISIGAAASNYLYGVQVFTATESGLTFEYDSTDVDYSTVSGRPIDTGWETDDYVYSCTGDNFIICVNFRRNDSGIMNETDYTILIENATIEEV